MSAFVTAGAGFLLAVLWLASLVVVSAWTTAQQVRNTQVVYSGDNIGFRPTLAGGSEGTLVVRINGQWVEAKFAARFNPAK